MLKYYYDNNGEDELFIDIYEKKKWILLLGIFKGTGIEFNGYRIVNHTRNTYEDKNKNLPISVYLFGGVGVFVSQFDSYISRYYIPDIVVIISMVMVVLIVVKLVRNYENNNQRKIEEYITNNSRERISVKVRLKKDKILLALVVNVAIIGIICIIIFFILEFMKNIEMYKITLITFSAALSLFVCIYPHIFPTRKLSDYTIKRVTK